MFVGNQPLSSDPPDATTHCGADCCDYTKNKTFKNIKICEKISIRKVCLCVCWTTTKSVLPTGKQGFETRRTKRTATTAVLWAPVP